MGQMPDNRLIAFTRMSDLEDSREFSFPDIRRWKVLNTTGHPVGKVEEVFVDPNTLQPGWVLIHYQKFMNFNTKSLHALPEPVVLEAAVVAHAVTPCAHFGVLNSNV